MSLSIKCFEYFSLKSSFIFNRKMVALLGAGLTLSSYEAMGMDEESAGDVTMGDVGSTPKARRPGFHAEINAAGKKAESDFSLAGVVHGAGEAFSPPSDGELTSRTNRSNTSNSGIQLFFGDGNDEAEGLDLALMGTHLESSDTEESNTVLLKKDSSTSTAVLKEEEEDAVETMGIGIFRTTKVGSSPKEKTPPGKESETSENLMQLRKKPDATRTAVVPEAARKYVKE